MRKVPLEKNPNTSDPWRCPETQNAREEKTKKTPHKGPQKEVDKFWDKFINRNPNELHTILPRNSFAGLKALHEIEGPTYAQAAHSLYEQAEAAYRAAVEQISKECRRTNTRYRDPYFDLEFDLKKGHRQCLEGLLVGNKLEKYNIGTAKSVPDIFEKPEFYIEGAIATNIRQGQLGNCWLIAAISAITHKEGLISRVCVARDEAVGVYGFVFCRDGEWIYTIIDDQLYLTVPDYNESTDDRTFMERVYDPIYAADEHQKLHQTGSRALYFAKCINENETWLPLLEKAYAKAHGDFRALNGGSMGEGIEDLTGGMANQLCISNILDKGYFWKEELIKVNKEFLFCCTGGYFDRWRGGKELEARQGIISMHAYSIMEAREENGEKLLKLRNPWGREKWTGAWADGNEKWTPEWMTILKHKFGNDGVFWMNYDDFLKNFVTLDRVRLLSTPDWQTLQQWTTVTIPWMGDYNDTNFLVKITEKGPMLDDRYFYGLESQYNFALHFRLEKEGEQSYVARNYTNPFGARSTSVDLELEPGSYKVLMKITARMRYKSRAEMPAVDLVRICAKHQGEKLAQIGLRYDLAHAKGRIEDPESKKKQELEAKRTALKKEQREEKRAANFKQWLKRVRQLERDRRHKEKKKAKQLNKQAEKAKNSQIDPPTLLNATAETESSEPSSDQPGKGKGKGKGNDNQLALYEFNKWVQNAPHWVKSGTAVSSAPPPIQDDAVSISSFSSIDSVLDLESVPDEESDGEVPEKGDTTDPNAEFEKNPWNAVCVVGLRVCSKDNAIAVSRPTETNAEEELPLDLDDPNKAISESVPPMPTVDTGKAKEGEKGNEAGRENGKRKDIIRQNATEPKQRRGSW